MKLRKSENGELEDFNLPEMINEILHMILSDICLLESAMYCTHLYKSEFDINHDMVVFMK